MADTFTLTVKDVAQILGVHKLTIYAWCRSGVLPHVKIANTIRFNPVEIEQLLKGKKEVMA